MACNAVTSSVLWESAFCLDGIISGHCSFHHCLCCGGSGVSPSGLQRHMGLLGSLLNMVTGTLLQQKPALLASRVVEAASMPLPLHQHWSYMDAGTLTDPPKAVLHHLDSAEALWDLSADLLSQEYISQG